METINIDPEISTHIGVLNEKLQASANQIADFYTYELSQNRVALIYKSEVKTVYITLKYKAKKIDEKNHAVIDNLQSGEFEKIVSMFYQNCNPEYKAFDVVSIERRKSQNEGKCFEYELNVIPSKDSELKKACLSYIVKELKKLKIQKGEIIKDIVRSSGYKEPIFMQSKQLIKIAYTISK